MEIRSRQLVESAVVSEPGSGIVGIEIHESLRKLTFPLHLVDGGVKIIEKSPREYTDLDIQDRIMLSVALTQSVEQPDSRFYKGWLGRLVNKEADDKSIASNLVIANNVNALQRKGILEKTGDRLALTLLGARLLIENHLHSFDEQDSDKTGLIAYEDFDFDGSKEAILFEYIADVITQTHPNEPDGRYLPLDNMTNIALSLANEVADDVETSASEKSRVDYMWKQIKKLEQTYGVLKVDRSRVNKKSSIPINIAMTKVGYEAYIKHVNNQLAARTDHERSASDEHLLVA